MIKTQISVPDDLYKKAKQIAQAREWSLAEVFRRGLEYMVSTHLVADPDATWELPSVKCGEGAPKTVSELEVIIQLYREDYLLAKAGV